MWGPLALFWSASAQFTSRCGCQQSGLSPQHFHGGRLTGEQRVPRERVRGPRLVWIKAGAIDEEVIRRSTVTDMSANLWRQALALVGRQALSPRAPAVLGCKLDGLSYAGWKCR